MAAIRIKEADRLKLYRKRKKEQRKDEKYNMKSAQTQAQASKREEKSANKQMLACYHMWDKFSEQKIKALPVHLK